MALTVGGLRRAVRRRSARSSGWALVGQVAALVASLANFLLLARLLGPEEYGRVVGSWALVLVVAPVAVVGADRLLVRDVAAAGEPVPRALGAALFLALSGALVTGGALLLALPALLPQVPPLLVACLVLAELVVGGTASCVVALCFATDRARAAAVLGTTTSAAKLAAVVAFALTGADSGTRWAVLYAGCALVVAAGQLVWVVRRLGRPRLRGHRLLSRARQGLPFSLGFTASVVQKDVDKPLLVRAGYADEAGVYGVAYRLVTVALLPVLAVQQAMYARYFSAGGQGGVRASVALARRTAPALLLYAALVAGGLALAAPLVPVLVGPEYERAVGLLVLLAPLPVLRVLQALGGDALSGAGKERTRTACSVAGAGANLGINLVLIPALGLPAALLATFVSEVLLVLLVLVLVWRAVRAQRAAECDGRTQCRPSSSS